MFDIERSVSEDNEKDDTEEDNIEIQDEDGMINNPYNKKIFYPFVLYYLFLVYNVHQQNQIQLLLQVKLFIRNYSSTICNGYWRK